MASLRNIGLNIVLSLAIVVILNPHNKIQFIEFCYTKPYSPVLTESMWICEKLVFFSIFTWLMSLQNSFLIFNQLLKYVRDASLFLSKQLNLHYMDVVSVLLVEVLYVLHVML